MVAETPTWGRWAIYSPTGAGVTYSTSGAGGMYSITGAGAMYSIIGAGAMYSAIGAGLGKLRKDKSMMLLPLQACILAWSTAPEPSMAFSMHAIVAADSQHFPSRTTDASDSRSAPECLVRANAKQHSYEEHRAPNPAQLCLLCEGAFGTPAFGCLHTKGYFCVVTNRKVFLFHVTDVEKVGHAFQPHTKRLLPNLERWHFARFTIECGSPGTLKSMSSSILSRIVSSDLELFVDQVGNLSTSKETVLFLGFLFLQTDFHFEMGIMDDLVQGWSNPSHQVLQNSALKYHE